MAHGVPVDYIYGFLPDDRRAELATLVGGNGAGEHACPCCLTCANGCLMAHFQPAETALHCRYGSHELCSLIMQDPLLTGVWHIGTGTAVHGDLHAVKGDQWPR
jgi:hypothetical protein